MVNVTKKAFIPPSMPQVPGVASVPNPAPVQSNGFGISQEEIGSELQRRQNNAAKLLSNPGTPLPDKLDLVSKLMKTLPDADPDMQSPVLGALNKSAKLGVSKRASDPRLRVAVHLLMAKHAIERKTASANKRRIRRVHFQRKLASRAGFKAMLGNLWGRMRGGMGGGATAGATSPGARTWGGFGKDMASQSAVAGAMMYGPSMLNAGVKRLSAGANAMWSPTAPPAAASGFNLQQFNPNWTDDEYAKAVSQMERYGDYQQRLATAGIGGGRYNALTQTPAATGQANGFNLQPFNPNWTDDEYAKALSQMERYGDYQQRHQQMFRSLYGMPGITMGQQQRQPIGINAVAPGIPNMMPRSPIGGP